MSKSANSLDIYFHMANHYRKLNNTKSRVNSGCKKKTTIIDETEMKQHKKGNLKMESHGKVVQRNSRPKTRRNLSDMPPQMITKSRAQSSKSKGRTSSVARKSRGKSVRSGSQSSRNSSNSSNHAAGDTRNTSGERSTTHGVESIIKDSVNEHEYLQFALRITEDIIKNDLYNCEEMKRVFNSHIEANRGRLEVNKMRDQVRNLAKELNVKFNESEIYTLGPWESNKNYPICSQTPGAKCELIYVSKDMGGFDESKSAHSNYNENQYVKVDNISKKENQPIQEKKNCEKYCKSMNTLPKNKDNCDACTNTKVVVLKNTLIRGDTIDPQPTEDREVQVKSEILKIKDTKSAACCQALEKIWVVDVATSVSHHQPAIVPDKNRSKATVNINEKQESDSSIYSAEKFMESLENEYPVRHEIQSLIKKDITPAIQATSNQPQENSQKYRLNFDEEPDYKRLMQSNEDMIFKDSSHKLLSSTVRYVYHDKPREIKQGYLVTTATHSTYPTTTDNEYENKIESEPVQQPTTVKRHCTCGCCQKSEQPPGKTTIWDELDCNDVYNYPEESERKAIKKNDTETEQCFPTISPIAPKIVKIEQDLFENMEPEKEKKKCLCGKRNCALYCKSDDYAIYLPEMLAKFFPSVGTQITPSDLLLINRVKSDSVHSVKEVIEEEEDKIELVIQSSVNVYNPAVGNIMLSELSPTHSLSNMEKVQPKESSIEILKIDTPSQEKKVKGKVRTSVSSDPVTEYPIPPRQVDSRSDNGSIPTIARSASGTFGKQETTPKEKLREQSATYEKRKSSFTPAKLNQMDDEDEIPIIIPDRKQQEAFKQEKSNRDKEFNRDESNSRYDVELKSDVKSVMDEDDLGTDVENFMNQLDYKPPVTKTSSFDKQLKKTIHDGEMFRHPENRRIGFDSNSGIDLTRTSILEVDQPKPMNYENTKEEDESVMMEDMKDIEKNENFSDGVKKLLCAKLNNFLNFKNIHFGL
ncbi:uncharacterized protein [Onthophagus taurus]|uniref:uncharacterized protein isoform X1 n=3 Tax=Onthophagus taurus TaxID=166361 RepID=UPI0039BE0DA3